MSRIGKQPITVPGGVEVTISDTNVRVKGPKGQLEYQLVGDVSIARDGDVLNVSRADDARGNRSLVKQAWGPTKTPSSSRAPLKRLALFWTLHRLPT